MIHAVMAWTESDRKSQKDMLETRVLPQDSSGTGQSLDWTGRFAAEVSKHL